MKHALLMTATLRPPGDAPELQRTDPALRIKDYLQAFDFYRSLLGTVHSRLVFADNSDSDCDLFREAARNDPRITVLSFQANDHDPTYGRGYGEFRLIDEAIRQCPGLLTNYDRCWKVTGRYMIHNLGQIVSRSDPDAPLVMHCRNRKRYWADLYLRGWTPVVTSD